MRPGNSIHKKENKSRRTSPAARFALIVMLILAVGFLIFYIIDNPGFLGNLKSGLEGSPEGGEAEVETSSDIITEEDAENGPDTSLEEEDIIQEDPGDEIIGSDGQESPSQEDISFWQKIINFFTGRSPEEDPVESYPASIPINIYFSGLGDDEKLVHEERVVIAGDPVTAVRNAVQELLKGPDRSYHFPVIPAGTKLLGVEVYENLAKIDLSQEFLENSLDTRILDEYIIYSIVNTLTEIPEINGIIFFIDGKRVKLFGSIDLSIPAIRDTGYIEEKPEL